MHTHRSQSDWAKLDIEKMGRDELLALIPEVAQEMDSIRGQIEKAQVDAAITGVYSDRDWFRRAKSALRGRGRLHQRIQTRISQLRSQLRVESAVNSRSFERVFIQAAKELLPQDTYERILQVTQGRVDDGDSA